MGTMTQGICKLKNNEKKNKKIQHERMRQGMLRVYEILALSCKFANIRINKKAL